MNISRGKKKKKIAQVMEMIDRFIRKKCPQYIKIHWFIVSAYPLLYLQD